jgi:hypothetical protein
MRFLIPAAAVLLFAAQVQAQTTTPAAPATPAPAPAMAAPAAPAPAAAMPAKPKKVSHKITLQQHFDAANSSKDGHLTKDQATAAKWGYVTSNYSSIDKDHKGYVTVDDIRDYAKARHAAKPKKPSTAPAAAPATPPATNG